MSPGSTTSVLLEVVAPADLDAAREHVERALAVRRGSAGATARPRAPGSGP